MSSLLQFAQFRLQEIALVVMGLVYTTRLIWLFRFKAGRERQAPTGRLDTSRMKGALYSMANIAMPWAMESTRQHPLFYAQFVVFHLGVVAAISLSFIIPYAPGFLTPGVILTIQVLCGAAFLVGILRMVRRIRKPVMRLISTPDDYFSLALLTSWFVSAIFAAPNTPAVSETPLLAFFFLTGFFLLYVPFSKISHYLYYPFGRFYLGRSMGHRGVFPLQRMAPPASAVNLKTRLELSEASGPKGA